MSDEVAKKVQTMVITVEAPQNLKKGETFEVEIEIPKPERRPRGQLAGIAIEDMTDEQLKREIINANSVLYKATQRGAAAETIAANQARVDAAKAEKAKRAPAPVATDEGVYSEETAAEL